MMTITERLARALADFNRRRDDADYQRQVVGRVLRDARDQAVALAEARSTRQRLELATRICLWGATFPDSPEGRWALGHWRRWPVALDLEVDAGCRLWRVGMTNPFGRVPDRLIVKPEDLADAYSTARLRAILAATEADFWRTALWREIRYLLMPRGAA